MPSKEAAVVITRAGGGKMVGSKCEGGSHEVG